jgi:hypothetical protein
MHELRYATRVLWRSPGFAAIAILSLALGIGANTAIFSVSWVLFSQPLAVQNPDGLMAITNRLPPDIRGMAKYQWHQLPILRQGSTTAPICVPFLLTSQRSL